MRAADIMSLSLKMVGMKEIPEDSGIYVAGGDIRKVLFSIDVTTEEILVAKNLGCDAVIGHHPIGSSVYNWHEVFERHVDFMLEHGIPLIVARKVVDELKERVHVQSYNLLPSRLVSAARLLGIGLMNIHNPCDEMGRRLLVDCLPKQVKGMRVREVVEAFMKLREFREDDSIRVRLGSPDSVVKRLAVIHGAGTYGGHGVAKAYFDHGVDTAVFIRFEAEELRKLKEAGVKGNLIVLGHEACDSLGINPFLRELERSGVQVVAQGITGFP